MDNKLKILIADDSEFNREMLKDMLEREYEILEASNGIEAISIIERDHEEIAILLLDLIMPALDGLQVLQFMAREGWLGEMPVMMISSDVSPEVINKAYDLGVGDYIGRPFNETIIKRRVQNMIMLSSREKKLECIAAEAMYDRDKSNKIMINILSHIVEFRNGESGPHVIHINKITKTLLRQLKTITNKYDLSDEKIELISTASSLHDIGKMGVPNEILNKPAKLTDVEFEVVKTHSAIGADMLEKVPAYQDEELVKVAKDICNYHHEKYDGKGYPYGLVGDEIPISAQVVSLADCYDALTSERCYKKAYSHEKAIEMLLNGECGQFNPLLIECLKECEDTIRRKVKEVYTENDSKSYYLNRLVRLN